EHRRIALGAAAKFEELESILKAHPRDRVIVFTQDNETVYQISRALLIPAITHQTRTRERREILLKFNRGEYLAVLTSKVLNEGVNVPEANVAVVLSGSATIREHVQRLGRILRPREGKEAVLYEVVTKGTMEKEVSRRRRQHSAYAAAGEGDASAAVGGEEEGEGDGPARAGGDAGGC
ncbi:MAG: helicase-related protein, partial [Myxococcota bacterium]|nr:helicase-related protein [Myxococcota bacterium]